MGVVSGVGKKNRPALNQSGVGSRNGRVHRVAVHVPVHEDANGMRSRGIGWLPGRFRGVGSHGVPELDRAREPGSRTGERGWGRVGAGVYRGGRGPVGSPDRLGLVTLGHRFRNRNRNRNRYRYRDRDRDRNRWKG